MKQDRGWCRSALEVRASATTVEDRLPSVAQLYRVEVMGPDDAKWERSVVAEDHASGWDEGDSDHHSYDAAEASVEYCSGASHRKDCLEEGNGEEEEAAAVAA
jgi:hypothetical protein